MPQRPPLSRGAQLFPHLPRPGARLPYLFVHPLGSPQDYLSLLHRLSSSSSQDQAWPDRAEVTDGGEGRRLPQVATDSRRRRKRTVGVGNARKAAEEATEGMRGRRQAVNKSARCTPPEPLLLPAMCPRLPQSSHAPFSEALAFPPRSNHAPQPPIFRTPPLLYVKVRTFKPRLPKGFLQLSSHASTSHYFSS